MNHTETLTRYVVSFIDELVNNGLTDVVISPGSRSTPLAMTVCEHDGLSEWVMIDERSAAFFALGIAKETKRPVALICTSGTAAANYFPAIVESYHARVPLIILTADRPHELRDVGAPQAIEQIKMYGEYVKWFQEMALPEASDRMLSYVREKAARAVYEAGSGNAGPVHLNFPFREPLIPDFSLDNLWGNKNNPSHYLTYNGEKRLTKVQLNHLINKLTRKQKGIIVCGPQVDEDLAQAITKLASKLAVPILADPLSQLRAGKHEHQHIVESYDAIFRNPWMREQLKPEYIIRFGAMPVSKSYLFYLEENHEIPQYIVEEFEGFRDPTGNTTQFIYANPVRLCEELINTLKNDVLHHSWLEQWQQMNHIAKKHLLAASSHGLTEGEAVKCMLDVIPTKSNLYVGNSMAVRDLDTFFMTTEKEISVLANRGTNGIDGMISSALGAATAKNPLTLLIGDLSFYHDLNGLLAAKHYDLNITILLINNNGGGIFSFLPQANEEKSFERLFGTPVNIDFGPMVTAYGGKHSVSTSKDDLIEQLIRSYQHKGLSVIEVQTDRTENVNWHRQLWSKIEQELLQTEW